MELNRPTSNPHTQPGIPRLPRSAKNADGQLRCVGVELEFTGLTLGEICRRLQASAGGRIVKRSDYEAEVVQTRVGRVGVELDAALFRDLKVKGFLEGLELDRLSDQLAERVEGALADGAQRLVPFEVVFDPLPIACLGQLDPIRAALRPGAEGTHTSLLNAFGLHLNPEVPSVEPAMILRYLRAFLVLHDRLCILHDVDIARRVSPFIDPFPDAYINRVLQPDYAPDGGRLIDDYLKYNPTRNRPLDLLPLLAWIDEDRVRAALPEEKISRRPAFHYRLPNSQIDEAQWRIVGEWNRWMEVEDLAADEGLLAEGMRAERLARESPLTRFLERFWK